MLMLIKRIEILLREIAGLPDNMTYYIQRQKHLYVNIYLVMMED